MVFAVLFFFLMDLYAFRLINGMSRRISCMFWMLNLWVYLYFLSGYLDIPSLVSHPVSIYIRAFIIIYFFAKAVFVIPLVFEDLVRFGKWIIQKITKKPERNKEGTPITRQEFVKNISVTLSAMPFLFMGYGVVRNIYRYQVIRQKLKIKDLPRDLHGLKIVQISDVHSGTFPLKEPVMKGIEMINQLEPDIFVFTGDLVNSTADEIDPFIEYFAQIEARYGKFSMMGNHDYGDYHKWTSEREKLENDRAFVQKHGEMGWELLRNEHKNIQIGKSRVGVIGVENYSTLPQFPQKGDLRKATAGMEETDFSLLLSHDPTHWKAEVTEKYNEIDLTLSGHTHGFQFGIEIPGVIRWSPAQYIYKEWAGMYQTKNQFLYVNRGYGVLGYPGRVGILPEITLIELETV